MLKVGISRCEFCNVKRKRRNFGIYSEGLVSFSVIKLKFQRQIELRNIRNWWSRRVLNFYKCYQIWLQTQMITKIYAYKNIYT